MRPPTLSADEKKRPGNELPDDVKRKFEELRQKLEKFLAQQKKVIEASENLAKKPVEDFTQAGRGALEGTGGGRRGPGEVS